MRSGRGGFLCISNLLNNLFKSGQNYLRKAGVYMEKNRQTEEFPYGDGDIPEIDLPKESWITETLPESTRPRKDGPGGDGTASLNS